MTQASVVFESDCLEDFGRGTAVIEGGHGDEGGCIVQIRHDTDLKLVFVSSLLQVEL